MAIFDAVFSSLAKLNARLIGDSEQAQTSVAEEAEEENGILGAGAEASGYTIPAEDSRDSVRIEVRGRFSAEDPLEYNRVKEWIEANIFGGDAGGQAGLINGFVNEWDVRFREEVLGTTSEAEISRLRRELERLQADENATPEQIDAAETKLRRAVAGNRPGDGPTLEMLLGNQDFLNGAMWLPLTGTGQVPPVFESTYLDEETGAEVPLVGVANPLTGVEFVEITETVTELADNQPALASLIRSGSKQVVNAIEKQLRDSAQAILDDPSIPAGLTPRFSAVSSRAILGDPDVSLPVIRPEELTAALTQTRKTSSSSSSTRRDLAFDKNQLLAEVGDLYNRWMLDPSEAPAGVVEGIVDSYIGEASSFWSNQGGQLDFDTYVRGKLKELPRYKQIYKHMQPFQSEEQFLQSFMSPISSLGQTGEFTRSQTEAAVTSGGGPAAQFKRVSRTREVEQGGGFSQKLAKTLAGIGVG